MNVLRLTQIPTQQVLHEPLSITRFGLVLTHLFPLSRELQKKGVSSHFFSGGGMNDPARETVDGFDVRRTRLPSKPFFLPYGAALKWNWKTMVEESGDMDVVHAHNPHYAYGFPYFRVDAPLVITVHGTFHYSSIEKPLLQQTFAAASHVIAINQPSVKEALSLGVEKEKISLIHTAVDPSLFFPQKVPKEKELLFVGRLVKWKKVDMLIRALARLPAKHRAWTVRIVGDGPELESLQELAAKEGVSPRVHFVQAIPQEELPRLYSRASFTLVPHEVDSFGKTVIESLACGTPVIGTNHDIPETVQPAGWFYPHAKASDPQTLATTIQEAIESRDAHAMGKKGPRIVQQSFTWEKVAEQNKQVYRTVTH